MLELESGGTFTCHYEILCHVIEDHPYPLTSKELAETKNSVIKANVEKLDPSGYNRRNTKKVINKSLVKRRS